MARQPLASVADPDTGDGFDAAKNASTMHTLVLTGELDRTSAHTLEAAIERLCERGIGGITLDLRGLAHIDSTGVAVIAFRCMSCRRQRREFVLVPGPWFIQRAFELAGLADTLPFVPDEGERTATGPSHEEIASREHAAAAGARATAHRRTTSTRRDRGLSIVRSPGREH